MPETSGMPEGAGPPSSSDGQKKGGGFSSVRSIWQERVKEVELGPLVPKFPVRPGGRTSSGGTSAPPQSPSSRANALLSQTQEAAIDPFQQYGIAFADDNSEVLTIRKVTPGSAADQTGAIFPGDALHEVNGMDVYKWPLERVTPLASGDRAGTTLRLAFERVGFSDNIHVELELGKSHARPSPRLSPLAAPPPPMSHAAATQPPLHCTSAGSQSPVDNGPGQDYEEYQAMAPQPSFEDTTISKDEMRINVVKRYKSKIQELSQGLEESQVASAQQARQVEELTRFLNEKDELLKELREAVGKLTNKLEESSRENYDMRRRMNEQGQLDPASKSSGGDSAHLSSEVQRLATELENMRNQRDIAQLSSLPSDDTSDLLRELKLQIIEKDAKVQDLEGKNASLKRSNVIQAVELQELHDHVAGMEKQKIQMQVQQFPPLPPLQSVRESPYETPMDEDDKMKAIMLADEVLQKAQEEIAVLKQKDQRRMQLEVWTEQSQHEIHRLRQELAEIQGGGEGVGTSDSVKRERDELQAWSQQAHAEIESLRMELSRSKSQADLLTQQLAGLDTITAKVAELHQNKMILEQQLQTLRSHNGPAGPSAAGPVDGGDVLDSSGSLLDHPLMQNLGMLDIKQQELQKYIANMSTSQNGSESTSGKSSDAASSEEVGQRDHFITWLKSQLRGVDEQLKAATYLLHSPDEGMDAPEVKRHVEMCLKQACDDMEAMMRAQPSVFKESALVQQMSQLTVQLRGQDVALAKLTASLESGDKIALGQIVAETQQVEVLKARVEELARSKRLMDTEMELTKDAYANSREQFLAAEVEIKMLRSHLDSLSGEQASLAQTEGAQVEEQSARLFESVLQEKRAMEDALNKMRDDKHFVEGCLTDARMDISRMESENESSNNSLHDSQLAVAKMEGKLQAAHTRVASLEKDLNRRKEEMTTLHDEIKRCRQSMIQSDSEKSLENATLRNETQYLKQENDKMKKEATEWTGKLDEMAQNHLQQMNACEQEIHKMASEKSGLSGSSPSRHPYLSSSLPPSP